MGAEGIDEVGPRGLFVDSRVVKDGGKEGEVEGGSGRLGHARSVARADEEVKKRRQ
jgi:hypothetical protein